MSRIQLTKQSTVTFKRIDTRACTHYEIYAREKGTDFEYLLDKIENPKTPSPYKKVRYFKLNKEKYWDIKEQIMAKTSSDVTVYINSTRLNTGQYTFSSALGVLNIHCNINPRDSIRMEYYVDRLEYVHNTSKTCEYRIVPIFKGDYRLGDHSYLNHKEY